MTPAADLVRGWLEHSPFAGHLGIELVSLGEGEAELRLPFREELATMGDVVHGGAISSLVDTAAAAAAVAAADGEELSGGTTVDLSVSLVGAARGADVAARARVIRAGRAITFIEVDVEAADRRPVAKGLVTYRTFTGTDLSL
ncbi:MAG TPA: PaaI family thioesterase [Solirubrobacterales bacterium]